MRKRIAPLTGVRGVAATWVVLFHGRALLDRLAVWPDVAGSRFAQSGYLAVDLFFILSGYILARSQASRLQRTRIGSFAAAFYLNRAFRILPLNAVCLFLLLGAAITLGPARWPTPTGTAQSFVAALLLVQNWGLGTPTSWNVPAWSLSTEWLAYGAFPVALWAILGRLGPRGAAALHAAALAALVVVMLRFGQGSLAHTWLLGLPRCLLQFVAGMALWRWSALLVRSPRGDPILAAGVALLVVAVAVPGAELLAPFAFSAIVLACALDGRVAEALLGNRLVEFVGEISFSLYLVHFTMLALGETLAVTFGIVEAGWATRATFALACFAATYGAAVVLWRWVELPGQRAGQRLEGRWLRAAPPPAIRPSAG